MPQVTLDELVAGAKSGLHLISFPTDTVPALAARPDLAEMIFAAKQRSADKPLIMMAAHASDVWPYVSGTPEERSIWLQVVERYWPGALTLVLPASDRVPLGMNPNDPATIGVRVPNHELAHTILTKTGPLATTSANRSGEPALQTMQEITIQFPQVLTLVEEPELQKPRLPPFMAQAPGVPSTVVQWTGDGWTILRQGAVIMEDFE